MAGKLPHRPRDVADAFVKQYYTILGKFPENAHKFYAESSLLSWPESDGVITPVTTSSAINDKILSSNYKNCFADVSTVDAQASHDGGVFVAVTGSFLKKEEVKTLFFQTFFLARQEKGFFIRNDILRVLDVCGSGAYDAPTVQSDAYGISVLEDTVAKESAPSAVAPAAKKCVPSAVAPATNVDVKPVVAQASNVAPKITYATVVAKTTPVSSSRAAPVTPKASAPLANSAPNASAPSLANGSPKPLASETKGATKSTDRWQKWVFVGDDLDDVLLDVFVGGDALDDVCVGGDE